MIRLAPSPTGRRRSVVSPPVTECAVRAYAAVQAAPDALARLRQNPGPVPGEALPGNFLRHADEQTVVGLAAVLQAIAAFGLTGQSFEDWGVLAAPHFIGRQIATATMDRFVREGARTTSPHIIPHRSLHSVSGAISVALQIHGPNFGIGGGPGALAEGLAAACTLLADASLPGAWLVLTQWDPESVLDERGLDPAPGICHGVALAVVPPGTAGCPLRLRYSVASGETWGGTSLPGRQDVPCPHVARLAEFLLPPNVTAAESSWACVWAGGSRLEIVSAGG